MSKYYVGDFEVGDCIIASGNRLGVVSNITKKITVTWENGLSGEYTPKQMQAWNYRKFLEEKEATECNLHNLTSAQELVQDSALQDCNMDLNSLEPQRLTNTAQASSNCDIPAYTTTETCEISQDLPNKDLDIICTQEELTLLQPPLPALHFPQKANGLEVQMSEIVSPPSSKPLENYNQGLQPLKTSQDLSPAQIIQDSPQAHISEAWLEPLTSSGTMRNGLLSEAVTLPAPTLESEYCWLRSPGALSLSGKGRPPGQTKQEAELKKLGLINSCEVLNPAILCQWYEIPDSWLDPSECRAATELLEEYDRQQEIFSILESQRSPLTELSTSTHYAETCTPVTRANAQPETYIINQSSYKVGRTETVTHPLCAESLAIIKDNLGFGFFVNWLSSSEQSAKVSTGILPGGAFRAKSAGGMLPPVNFVRITYNWERDDQFIAELAIAPQHLIDKFLEEKLGYETIPENFLEETEPHPLAVQKRKGRQRKGCLYRYIENKKLKSGAIASYPRVNRIRNPDNPTHWRWGFNWEEKIDGEWKGRSIGSVPLGAMASTPAAGIALIQSMQNEGVSLEEIIAFIRRAKAKK